MRNAGVNLTQRESELIDETRTAAMSPLDTDALMDLHARVRRARNKYVTLYRRRGAAKVRAKGARGVAAEANERGWAKAEVFEEALARVSRQLAVAAKRSACELKQERLARARGEDAPAKAADKKKADKKKADKKKVEEKAAKKPVEKAAKPRKNAGRVKFEASTKAAGARRQAKRDSR